MRSSTRVYPVNSAMEALAAIMARSLFETRIEGSGDMSSKWLTSAVSKSMSFGDLDEFGNK